MQPDRADARWRPAIVALAGTYGALGVIGSATAAHRAGGAQLATASLFLLLHATLVIGLVAISLRSHKPFAWLAIAGAILLGAGLFSGDVALFALAGHRLFPMAAPTGGSLLIASWASIAVLAVWRGTRDDSI